MSVPGVPAINCYVCEEEDLNFYSEFLRDPVQRG